MSAKGLRMTVDYSSWTLPCVRFQGNDHIYPDSTTRVLSACIGRMNVHSYAVARESIAHLELAGANLSKSLGRLSSGIKVKTSEDDAGGLAVSSKLNSAISRSVVLGENVQNGRAHVANLSGVGGNYDPGEAAPAINITGANKNTLAGTATINGNGTLDVNFTGNPSDFNNLTAQAANGTLRAPATLTGMGGNHDPTSPPAVTISGADKGTLAGVSGVNPDRTVNISFTGAPTGNGPLTVQIPGGVSSDPVSQTYLLEIDGDLWDYSVAEFDTFTELIADARAQNGAEQNSLNTFWNRLSTKINQLEQATGRITDADFAEEMTRLGKSQILSQSASSMLAKHNRITTEALLTLQQLGTNL